MVLPFQQHYEVCSDSKFGWFLTSPFHDENVIGYKFHPKLDDFYSSLYIESLQLLEYICVHPNLDVSSLPLLVYMCTSKFGCS